VNARDRKKELEAGLPAPVYHVFGSPFLVEETADRITEALFPEGPDDFNFHVFHAASTPAEDVVTAADTLPFMAPRRLVLVKEAQAFRAAAKKVFGRYLEHPAPQTCLVFLSGAPDRKNAFLKFLKEKGCREIRVEISENRVPMWLRERAAEKGIRLTPEAERHLLDLVGPDLAALAGEIEKLSLSGAREIDLARVEETVGHVRDYTPFAIVEAIRRGDMERALRILKALRDGGQDAVGLLGLIGWHYRQLFRRDRKKKGFEEVFEALHRADLDLKATGKPEALVLESLLFSLMRPRKRPG